MNKFLITVLNPGESAADNGRMIHALTFASSCKKSDAEFELIFSGKAVEWVPKFLERNDDSNPFVKHYGYYFDEVISHIKVCNMCCKRFDVHELISQSDVPIVGVEKDHIDLSSYITGGYQFINF